MEEIEDYLSGEGIDVKRYEYWEEEVQDQFGQWISCVQTEEVLKNESIHLVETTEGILVMNSSNYPELPNYQIFRGWAINRNPPEGVVVDDEKGWISIPLLTPTRKRLWEQLLVPTTQFDKATSLLPHFHAKFRAINLSFLRRALGSQEYTIQMVLECQRYSNGLYSAYNLQPHDPPAWSRSPTDHNESPCQIPTSNLIPITSESFRLPIGWTYLHDFMFVTYPCRDLSGWQYANDFNSNHFTSLQFQPIPISTTSPSSPTPTSQSKTTSPHNHNEKNHNELFPIRRRLWIRTIVKENNLPLCRELFSNYIQTHPRGHIIATKLYRQSHYRKRWSFGVGLLIDREIHIFLDNNYQHHVVYPLEGCEVTVLSQRSRDSNHHNQIIESSSHHDSSLLSPFPLLGNQTIPRKFHLFGLKFISNHKKLSSSSSATSSSLSSSLPSTSNSTQGLEGTMQCIFSTLTNKDRDLWISCLYHQLSLVNQSNYPIPTAYSVKLGPVISDSTSQCGKLWRRTMSNQWKLNYFELRRNGRLSCYKNGVVFVDISLKDCHLEIPNDVFYHHPFGIYNGTELILMLATEGAANQRLWITALQHQIDCCNRTDLNHSESPAHGWLDSFDLIDRSSSPSDSNGLHESEQQQQQQELQNNNNNHQHHNHNQQQTRVQLESIFHHSTEINSSSQYLLNAAAVAAATTTMTTPLIKYFCDKLYPGFIYEPIMNVRIESYNTLRESNQLSDYDNEEEFENEFNREESDDSIHSFGQLLFTEIKNNNNTKKKTKMDK